MEHEVIRPSIYISEDELNEVRQCMHDGDALNANNQQLRQQIGDVRAQQNQINYYQSMYRQVIDMQDELIKSLSNSILELNQPQVSTKNLPMIPTPPAPSPLNATSGAASLLHNSGDYSMGFQEGPNEVGTLMQADDRSQP